MKKQLIFFFCLITCYLSASAQTKSFLYENNSNLAGGQFNAVSNNGRFVAGHNAAYTIVFLLDTKTGELQEITGYGYVEAVDVTDNGVLVGKFQDPDAILANGTTSEEVCIVPGIYKNGAWIAVERNQYLNGGGYDGRINTVSADGKLMGGHIPATIPVKDNNGNPVFDEEGNPVSKASTTIYEPVIWGDNGKIVKKLPYYTSSQGASIKSMSNDGNVACGWYDGSLYGHIIIWKNGERVDTNNYKGTADVVSANGQFVGGGCGEGMSAPRSKPFIWSEENGLAICENIPGETQYGQITGITDDGKIAVGYIDLAGMTENRKPAIIIDGVYHNFDTWINDNYGLKGPYGSSFWTAKSISNDGNVICGIGYYDGARAPWVVVIDEAKVPDDIPADGIDNVVQELDVNVAFNAISGMLNIEGEYTSVNLFNTVGACVLTDNSAESTIQISNLNEGIYFAKVMKGKATRTFKVAITR